MRGRVMVAVLLLVGVLVVGVIIQMIGTARMRDARLRCLNNFRLLHQVTHDLTEFRGYAPKWARTADVPGAIPPGTIFTSAKLPADRLSWVADGLTVMEQSLQPSELLGKKLDMNNDRMKKMLDALRQPTNELAGRLDRAAPWNAGPNAEIGQTRLKIYTCPGNLPADGSLTQYVGLAGVGSDAAELPLFRPFAGSDWMTTGRLVGGRYFPIPTVSARAGCFRYDAATPLSVISSRDGLDTTLLFAEVSADLGPWIRGGPSTVRGYDIAAGAKPPVGFAGQFGGNHPQDGATVGYAGGSATFVTSRVSPAVFRMMLTIAGGKDEVLGME